ncbi:MAG: potassium-transporting ATPase subunit KdpA [Thermoanaerobaculia bacterium]
MTANSLLQLALYPLILVAAAWPLGLYMAKVYQQQPTGPRRWLAPLENRLYRLAGVVPEAEMSWQAYAKALLLFSAVGVLALYALERCQGLLPANPQGLGAVAPDLALNTAVSFVTNTNWQAYAGESAQSYLSQMLGLAVQNFLSAASGMAVLVALVRGLSRRCQATVGNFWVDLTRSVLYILLPLSLVLALVLVALGVPQTFAAYPSVAPLEATQAGGADSGPQLLALGPVASQAAIQHLGTNGGGFFNTNSAHPFANPSPLSDFLLLLAMTVIPAGLCISYGRLVGDPRQGRALLACMLVVLVACQLGAYAAEAAGNPALARLGVDPAASDTHPGGNLEGKEVRFGVARSALFAAATTATSSGAVNAMHDSFTPLGGLVPLLLMHFGEVILGGVGSGLYGMLIFVLIAVFVAGLMVGRTPEYLGKKIEAFEVKMAALIALIMPLVVLGASALAVVVEPGTRALANPGAHGFSEILYAYSSQGNNNGSAFAGLAANSPFYNLSGALTMLLARFWLAIPTLAIAGSLAAKKTVPQGPGTLPTHTGLFAVFLLGVVVLVGVLTFLPALALGPIVEQLQMLSGGH